MFSYLSRQWQRVKRVIDRNLSDIHLFRVRRRLFAQPLRTSGVENYCGYRIRINDGPNFYMQYKDEFVRRIYHFDAVRADPLIIDGGSNIGMSILYFKRIYPAARIVGFEPDPVIFEILKENVTHNQLQDVTLVQAALGEQSGTSTFVADGTAGGYVPQESQTGSFEVQIERLSDYLAQPVDFLKLNIEGQELPVLQEAAASGKLGNVRELVLEYHGWPGAQQRLAAILELLDKQGFRYLVHDFDSETCPGSKPPFHLTSQTVWFCLVYARRLSDW